MPAAEAGTEAAMHADWLRPDWRGRGAGAVMTTRAGGVSAAPFDSMNLRAGLGDATASVQANLARLQAAIGVMPVLLEQVHGAAVVRLTRADTQPGATMHRADAAFTTEPGLACAVQVADCLPVLFAAPRSRAVAAAHAGWRGLAGGVLEATLAAVCEAGRCAPGEVSVWLGAGIGPRRFEVGADVLLAFGCDPAVEGQPRFRRHVQGKWLADLPGLARDRLTAAGARAISGGDWCTVEDASRFFSFRRDGLTGRMVAAVWIDPAPEAAAARRARARAGAPIT